MFDNFGSWKTLGDDFEVEELEDSWRGVGRGGGEGRPRAFDGRMEGSRLDEEEEDGDERRV